MSRFWFGDKIERTEHVTILLEMLGDTYHDVRSEVDSLGTTGIGVVRSNDTVKINFDFTVEYSGVVQQLEALIKLMDDPRITNALIGERDDLDILFVRLVDAIRGVQEKVDKAIQEE
jgi:hypothetical protein